MKRHTKALIGTSARSVATFRESIVIPRPRLLSSARYGSQFRVILIAAPAGFGKSTLIRQILEERSNVVYLRVQSGRTSLYSFADSLARACSDVFRDIQAPDYLSNSTSNTTLDFWIRWAIANLTNRRCFIAIDDLQNASSDTRIVDFLTALTNSCGQEIQWLFASRTRRTLPQLHAEAYGKVDAIITADDLRMTADEAHALASALGSKQSTSQIDSWVEQTRGFPVPLAFAIRISAQAQDAFDISDAPREITFRFLADQLWRKLSIEDRKLLQIAAIIPTSHIHDYEDGGFSGAAMSLSLLAEDITFLNLGRDGQQRWLRFAGHRIGKRKWMKSAIMPPATQAADSMPHPAFACRDSSADVRDYRSRCNRQSQTARRIPSRRREDRLLRT